jgi:hypothetical protein
MNNEGNEKISDITIFIMTEGHPGALNVLNRIVKETKLIDPQNALGGLGCILQLNDLQIYGSRIWDLYKDVCRESIVFTIGIFRALQLDITTPDVLNHAIDNNGEGVNVLDIMREIRKNINEFSKEN